MKNKSVKDWPLFWATVKDHSGDFFTLAGIGLICGTVGGGICYLGFTEVGVMIFGGLFALIGLFLFISAFVTTYSSIDYYYGLALLRKHGIEVDGVLTNKEAECEFRQEYNHRNKPAGEGYYECNLLVEFDFQFNGENHSGAFYLSKVETFDKLREGDPVPLKVLRLDPSVYKVRERRLANMLKGREPQMPSLVPVGAEIGQLV